MDIFPIIQPELVKTDDAMPLYKEVAWDFEKGQPIFKDGNPIFVTGKEAVKVWIWKALITGRKKYEIYTHDFGNEAETLLGQNFSPDTKRAEASRYVRECLEINPYITDISDIRVEFADSTITICATVSTVYGEVEMKNVRG